MPIKQNDFLELEYTGTLKEEKIVFDTTDSVVAKANGLDSEGVKYGPVIVCVGQRHLVSGLDKFLIGKDLGKFSVEINPEDAFGKKDAKLMRMVPTNKFLQQKIRPVPGLQVNIDGISGLIKTVNGGRTIVDFNHPLSGKVVVYEGKVNRMVTDTKEKVIALGHLLLGKTVDVKLEGGVATFESLHDVPAEVAGEFQKKFKELCSVDFKFVKKEEKK